MKTKTKTKKNYPFQAAGRTWTVPRLTLTELPDGTAAIAEDEIRRVHLGIANEICGSEGILSMAELEFLCDVTDTTFVDVASALQIHRSTVTRWRKHGEVSTIVVSMALKRWFWKLLFGESLQKATVPLDCAVDESKLLEYLKRETIDKHLADRIGVAKLGAL